MAYVDKPSTHKRSGAGIVLVSPKGENLEFVLQLAFTTMNNVAEYEAIIAKIGMA